MVFRTPSSFIPSSICSKNDARAALAVLRGMGVLELFVFPSIEFLALNFFITGLMEGCVEFLATLSAYKGAHPGLKIVGSVGGWNFPSAYFRSKLIGPP